MVNVAILGYGVVGSGVVEVIRNNRTSIRSRVEKDIRVSRILDLRDFPDSPDKDLFTKNCEDIFGDSTINVVVETIGGTGAAYEFTKRALRTGRHVVTSNKELVAKHGPELLKLAKENAVDYLFEASVGGGIPIIRPLERCLAANDIIEIMGILNGTTNYILTQMRMEGKGFDTALSEAQQKGYAEADPTADIEGHDACRKIAILSSIAYNEYVDYNCIPTEGISKITPEDMMYAEEMGSVIKLIAMSRKNNGSIYSMVCPMMVSRYHPLSNVDDVFNAIVVNGNAVGETMFYGRGAGKLPTASAVVADILDIAKHIDCAGRRNVWNVTGANNIVHAEDTAAKYFVRLKICNKEKARVAVREFFDQVDWVIRKDCPAGCELAFVTGSYPEGELKQRIEKLVCSDSVEAVENMIRVLD